MCTISGKKKKKRQKRRRKKKKKSAKSKLSFNAQYVNLDQAAAVFNMCTISG